MNTTPTYPQCRLVMREKGIAYPRTCTECGLLGPCKAFPPAGLAAAIGQPLPAYQARVIEEKSDLDVRFARLKAFIESDEVHKLDVDERTRLVRQRAAMHAYSQVLGERIAAFDTAGGRVMTTGDHYPDRGQYHQANANTAAHRPAPQTVDCRTCQNAGMGACNLLPGQCNSGSAYIQAPKLRFWGDA